MMGDRTVADLPLETDPVILRRVMPAEVVLPWGPVLSRALAVVTREQVYVWTTSGTGPLLALSGRYDKEASTLPHESRIRREPMALVLADEPASVVYVNKGRGCPCNHPLRSFRPWPGTPPRAAR